MSVLNVTIQDEAMTKKIIKLLEVFKNDGVKVLKNLDSSDMQDVVLMQQARSASKKKYSLSEAKKELEI